MSETVEEILIRIERKLDIMLSRHLDHEKLDDERFAGVHRTFTFIVGGASVGMAILGILIAFAN